MIQTGEKDWFKILDQAVISYNNTPHSTTKETPYKILYGMDPPAKIATTTGEEKVQGQDDGKQDEENEDVGVVEEKEEVDVEGMHVAEKEEREIVDLTNEPPHTAIRAQAHKTYVAQAQKMVDNIIKNHHSYQHML
jgi:hypothetical protein